MRIEALSAIPLVKQGDDLATLLGDALKRLDPPSDNDALVVAQKIVSKAQGRTVALNTITPSKRATELARTTHKDPRFVEAVLRESKQVIRVAPNVLIVEHKLGFIYANAGIDHSNVGTDDDILLLPEDPDASARYIAQSLCEIFDVELPVIINDSSGRPWRNGVVGMAIGCAGVKPLWDRRGALDLAGKALEVTEVGVADELAATASWLMGQGNEGLPAVLIRDAFKGTRADARVTLKDTRGIASILRSPDKDLFR